MITETRINLGIVFMLVIVLLFASCDLGQGGAKPWTGQKVYEMWYGGIEINPKNIIPNASAGNVYWYSCDVSDHVTYQIGITNAFGFNNGWQNLKDRAPNFAMIKVTCYNNDGIIFAELGNSARKATYYSLKNQKLYVSFEFLTDGYMLFYYNRASDN